jgi:hypothetical protein
MLPLVIQDLEQQLKDFEISLKESRVNYWKGSILCCLFLLSGFIVFCLNLKQMIDNYFYFAAYLCVAVTFFTLFKISEKNTNLATISLHCHEIGANIAVLKKSIKSYKKTVKTLKKQTTFSPGDKVMLCHWYNINFNDYN